jgi:hypothetical protein
MNEDSERLKGSLNSYRNKKHNTFNKECIYTAFFTAKTKKSRNFTF